MLVVRLIFILLVITAMVFLGLYILKRDARYLDFFKRTLLYAVYVMVLVGVLMFLRRLM